MAATPKSPGALPGDEKPRPLYYQILVLKCPVGCTHSLLMTSSDSEEVRAVAGNLACTFAQGGIACMVAETISWFPHQDVDPRSTGYVDRVAHMLRQIDAVQSGRLDDIPF